SNPWATGKPTCGAASTRSDSATGTRAHWHATATFAIVPAVTTPLPPVTVQVCWAGCAEIVTSYAVPAGRTPGNAKAPLLAIVRSWPLFASQTLLPAARPDTVPPTDDVTEQVTETFV